MITTHTTRRARGQYRDHPNRDTSILDVQIGERMRLGRMLRGMTQVELGKSLGLTFQQIQKYERGANRIGAGRLFRMAGLFEVPVTFFYVDIMEAPALAASAQTANPPDRVALDIMRQLARIHDTHNRKAVLNLARVLAEAADKDAPAVAAE